MYDTHGNLDARSAFSTGDLDTASPARVLVKCFDRLDLDLERALAAIETNAHEVTNQQLGHALDLLGEVVGMLDVDAWAHADALLSVYDYVLRLITVASMRKIAGPVLEAQTLLSEIGDGFRMAADSNEAHVPHAAQPERPDASDGARAFSVLA